MRTKPLDLSLNSAVAMTKFQLYFFHTGLWHLCFGSAVACLSGSSDAARASQYLSTEAVVLERMQVLATGINMYVGSQSPGSRSR